MKLEELFSGKLFISDLGETQTVTTDEAKMVVGQYAVWAPISGTRRHQIVEVGENLEELMNKYEISMESVCILA